MIDKITRKEIDRCNKAIINTRKIAINAKTQYRIQTIQLAEGIVQFIDYFRKYCQRNEAEPTPLDSVTVVKHSSEFAATYHSQISMIKTVYLHCTVKAQNSYKEEFRQVELLLTDIRDYLSQKASRG